MLTWIANHTCGMLKWIATSGSIDQWDREDANVDCNSSSSGSTCGLLTWILTTRAHCNAGAHCKDAKEERNGKHVPPRLL
mmetsp:Transcript_2441/g.5734  ORF Transcript_2441/g.5734 Transcript_2441/m.5734 type:complete len:80 (+) Transcript_2441:90-329(+)